MKVANAPKGHGRGAWSVYGGTTPFYQPAGPGVAHNSGQHRLKTLADVNCVDFRAVRFGVKAIQKTLNRRHNAGLTVDGNYGPATAAAVQAFQIKHSLARPDGRTGPVTSKSLFSPIALDLEKQLHLPGHYFCGVLQLESAWDAGAVGSVDYEDKGLAQWNRNASGYTNAQAFDPHFAINSAAERFAAAWKIFNGKSEELQIDCSIAQHNSPAWADEWFRTGKAPDARIENYVRLAKQEAKTFNP